MALILLLAILGAIGYRVTTADDRARYLARARAAVATWREAATRPRPEYDSFLAALKVRTPFAFVTTAIIVMQTLVFGGMMLGSGSMSDPRTLVGWGASVGPLTTNGGWWRLLTAAFVHTGLIHFLIDVAVLIQVGVVLERLIGWRAFASVFLLAGIVTSLLNLSSHPVAVTVASSGAMFGLFGLLFATLFWYRVRRDSLVPGASLDSYAEGESHVDPDPNGEGLPDAAARLTIPLIAVQRLGAVTLLFLLFSMLGGHVGNPELMAFVLGLVLGLTLAQRVGVEIPTTRQLSIAAGATACIALVCAVWLRNIADVKPEIVRVVATEERTAAVYQTALDAFKKGRLTGESLAQVADGKIVPELQAEEARLNELKNVPLEYQPLLADAHEYLRLRCESWRVRASAVRGTTANLKRAAKPGTDTSWRVQAEARHRSNMMATGRAEGSERASLEAFERMKAAAPSDDTARATTATR